MPPLPEKLTFTAWQRSKLFDLAVEQGARLGSSLPLKMSDADTGQEASGTAPFTLMSAADVAGIKPGAIRHMAPAPFARDAETTKFVHIDLWEPDLPWRYTPKQNSPALRPWLVLLVGTGEEMQVEGGIANVKDSVLSTHNLAHSHLWAHVQFDGHSTIGRLLSPRTLRPQSEYIAALVPAFNADGNDMWTVIPNATPDDEDDAVQRNFGSRGILPAFHAWRFWTAETGDFETLAAALHIPPARDVGKAQLHYRRVIPADAVNVEATLEVRGAITSLQSQVEHPDVIATVRADLDLLNDQVENGIGLPHYGRPWLPDPDVIPNGWPADLNDDPRYRGIAGLGTWMGVEAQEALMDAAVQQAGALREAVRIIGALALGLHAAGRLWERRLPAATGERLLVLGPVMGRMLASGGGFVLERITSDSSPLEAALFSSAAQRILRDRSSATRYLGEPAGGVNRNAALDAANTPAPPPDRMPDGLPHFDAIGKEMGLPSLEDLLRIDMAWLMQVMEQAFELAGRIVFDYRLRRDDLIGRGRGQEIAGLRNQFIEIISNEISNLLQARLPERQMPCEGVMIVREVCAAWPAAMPVVFAGVLEDDQAFEHFREETWRALVRCMTRRSCEELTANVEVHDHEAFCNDLTETVQPEPRPDGQPINLNGLAGALSTALDPRSPDAPARARVCSRLQGIDCNRLIPPEFPIGLDFPTWDLLRKYDKEWLLPGAGELEKDTITALQTNPAFIDAYMAGINSQFMSEMRWRDLAVERTSTPLRMFWGQVNYATGQRQADIEPLSEWAKFPAEPAGALAHQTLKPADPANTSGSRLVIAFRSDLFRRYPSTLVYLVRPAEGATEAELDALLKDTPKLDKPDAVADAEQWRQDRRYFGPIFAGTITPELTFFAFDVTPSDLDKYWLVLDEPPAELRFRNDLPRDVTNSATFARSTIDQPTRVAISGAELERQGMNQ